MAFRAGSLLLIVLLHTVWATTPHECGSECGFPFNERTHSPSCLWGPAPYNETGHYWDVQPHYHISDSCFDENDPCGPFYFNGMYHIMYQSRTQFQHWNASWFPNCTRPGRCGAGDVGISGGHAVSPDLVHWTEVEQAVWPDEWYTSVSVYDFSTTVVDGVPTIIAAGLTPNSTSPFCHVAAVPANLSDPYLRDWVYPDYNPLHCGTADNGLQPGDSPSNAWRTTFGEWRYFDAYGHVYTSDDFKTWTQAKDKFPGGICQDFYELPRVCDGCGASDAQPPLVQQPTHADVGAREWKLYAYDEGERGEAGALNATNYSTVASYASLGVQPLSDLGGFFAPKSFRDPKSGRRIMYGWNQAAGIAGGLSNGLLYKESTQSLLREVTYDPRLGMLNFLPIEEYDSLRERVLASVPGPDTLGAKPLVLDVPPLLANQSQVRVTFERPKQSVRFGVRVMTGVCGPKPTPSTKWCTPGDRFYTEFFVDYKPAPSADDAAWAVTVGSNRSTVPPVNPKLVNQVGTMPVLKSDDEIEIRVYVDQTVCEAFFARGRVAVTTQVPLGGLLPGYLGNNTEQGVELFASRPGVVTFKDAAVWRMGQIWRDVRTHDRIGPVVV